MKRLILIVALLPGLVRADEIVQNQYFGLNDNTTPSVINDSESQDLLNVDVSISGNSFKKRSGYGLYKNVSTPATSVHGGHHFFDTTGNDVQVWGSSTSLYGIVAGGTPTQLVSSATVRATWDCADTQGSAYCVNSSRDAFIKTNGATITWYTAPLGTMVEATPDRIIVAGVSGTPNTIYVSQSNTFTNFTVGVNDTDPFTEQIAAPGSRITHLRWGCGKVLWWKDQSFGSFDFDDQYNVSIKTISDTIGTFDNTSAIDPGGNVWFRGQEGHVYRYDCSFLTKETIPITPLIQASGLRTSNSWTQTTQTDFQAGSILPTGQLSATISPGDVIVSSFQASEYSSTQWSNGSALNVNVWPSSITLSTNNTGTATNPSFESALAGTWDETGTFGSNFTRTASSTTSDCVLSPQNSSNFALANGKYTNVFASSRFEIVDLSGNILGTASHTANSTCVYAQATATPLTSDIGKRVKFRLVMSQGGFPEYLTTSDSYILGGAASVYIADGSDLVGTKRAYYNAFDNIQNGSSTITSGAFTSKIYDTGFTSATYVFTNLTYTANTSSPSFAIITSSNSSGGTWSVITTTTATSGLGQRYVRWVSTISITGSDTPFTYISSATIVARSSGTFYSAVDNAANLSAWDTMSVTSQDNSGSHSFFIRASSNSFTVLSSTPAWVAATPGSLVTASTGTYFQLRDDFSVTAGTATPTLSNFTINWFEGTSADQSYMEYFDNAIWQTVAYGSGQSTNNYIFKCDLMRYAADPAKSCWTVYNFGAGGFLIQANKLYFGDPAAGNVFNYGTTTSDNGTAINAYRKSKEFSGTDPFKQNQLTQIDTFAKKDQSSTLTATYTTDGITSTSYSISLSTGATVAQSRKILPSGKLGYTFNMQYSDTSSSSAWEVFGYRITLSPLPYRVTVP